VRDSERKKIIRQYGRYNDVDLKELFKYSFKVKIKIIGNVNGILGSYNVS